MYRVMVVESGSDNIGEVLMAMSREDMRPFSDNTYSKYEDAMAERSAALKMFPAAIIEEG